MTPEQINPACVFEEDPHAGHRDPSEPVREYTHDWTCIDCGAVTRYPVALTRPSQIGCWRCGMQLVSKSMRFDDKRVKLFDPEAS